MALARTIIFIASLWLVSNATAGLPESTLPAGVGVNIHFNRGHEKDLDMIAVAGFKFVRMDLSWAETEGKKDEFDWSAYDELTANLDRRGIRAYYILDYSNPLYEESANNRNPVTGQQERSTISPQHPDSLAAYARWAAAAAKHFQGRGVILEIWNEPNISFWKPKPDVQQYTALALAACRAIREADPQATIVAPATSEFPWDFLETFLKSGVLEYLDGVSVHPYRAPKQSPETAAADFRRLRELIARYAPGRSIPVISGEWGYSSNTSGVSPQAQAAFIARQQLSNLASGIPLSIWYDWKNDGEDPAENEHNFGVVGHNLAPKPAYVSIETLTHELGGYHIDRRQLSGSQNDYVLLLKNATGAEKLAVWTLASPHEIRLDLETTADKKLRFTDASGKSSEIEMHENHFNVELTDAPKYIDLGTLRLK
jgi:polysaccharide biosynthesis protein PslG